jgi:K+-transporting ATPase A subunit
MVRTVVRIRPPLSVVSVIVLPALCVIANIVGMQDVRRSHARLSSVVEIVAMSLLPAAFIRTLGVVVGGERDGAALFPAVPIPFVIGAVAIIWARTAGHRTVISSVGTTTERTDAQFGSCQRNVKV